MFGMFHVLKQSRIPIFYCNFSIFLYLKLFFVIRFVSYFTENEKCLVACTIFRMRVYSWNVFNNDETVI